MSWLSWQFQRSIAVRELPGSWQSGCSGSWTRPGPMRLITYRAGVPEGEAARSLYQRLGFCPGRLVEVDGSPAQEFLRPAEIPGSERSEAE